MGQIDKTKVIATSRAREQSLEDIEMWTSKDNEHHVRQIGSYGILGYSVQWN